MYIQDKHKSACATAYHVYFHLSTMSIETFHVSKSCTWMLQLILQCFKLQINWTFCTAPNNSSCKSLHFTGCSWASGHMYPLKPQLILQVPSLHWVFLGLWTYVPIETSTHLAGPFTSLGVLGPLDICTHWNLNSSSTSLQFTGFLGQLRAQTFRLSENALIRMWVCTG